VIHISYYKIQDTNNKYISTATGKKVSKKYIHLSLSGLWSKRYAVKGESYNLNKYKTVYSVITDFIVTGS